MKSRGLRFLFLILALAFTVATLTACNTVKTYKYYYSHVDIECEGMSQEEVSEFEEYKNLMLSESTLDADYKDTHMTVNVNQMKIVGKSSTVAFDVEYKNKRYEVADANKTKAAFIYENVIGEDANIPTKVYGVKIDKGFEVRCDYVDSQNAEEIIRIKLVYSNKKVTDSPTTPAATKYTITFDNDGSVYHTLQTSGNENIMLPAAPTKSGCEFDGWYFDKDTWQEKLTSSTYARKTLTANVTVYAKWNRVTLEFFEFTNIDNDTAYAIRRVNKLAASVGIPSTYRGKPVTSIMSYAFSDCRGLTRIMIPDSVTSIESLAFPNCTGLNSITIPNSVTSFGDSVFNGCFKLTRIDFDGTKAQWNTISKSSNWKSGSGNFTVYCSDGTLTKAEA